MPAPLATPTAPAVTLPQESIASLIGLINTAIKRITPKGPFIVMAQWIRPQANTGASKFFTVTLADQHQSDIAIQGIIWDAATIQRLLEDGRRYGIDLQDRNARCEVALEVSIDCWVKKGSPYLRIHRLNRVGMTGLKQQAKEAALKALTEQGLLTTNRSIPWPFAPLRLAILTKPDSAACEDALSVLKRSGYAFIPTIIPVSVQGAHAEASILSAFRTLAAAPSQYDLVLLLRGGGSELDLMAYDLLSVAQAVARCPLPVITGLGHQIDHSLCDVVSAIAVETPTAAATAVVNVLQHLSDTLLSRRATILTACQQRLAQGQHRLTTLTGPILRRSLSRIHETKRLTDQVSTRILQQHGQDRLHTAAQQLQTLVYRIRTHGTDRHLTTHRQQLQSSVHLIHLRLQTVLHTWTTHLNALVTGIQSLDPQRLMNMGFCYLTSATGALIRSPDALSPNSRIHIHFAHHTIDAIITTPEEPAHDTRRTQSDHSTNTTAQPGRRVRGTQTNRRGRPDGAPSA